MVCDPVADDADCGGARADSVTDGRDTVGPSTRSTRRFVCPEWIRQYQSIQRIAQFRAASDDNRRTGSAGYTMVLPIEQKWRVETLVFYQILYEDGGGPPLPDPQVTYHYMAMPNWWSGIKPGYGPGVMHGRLAQWDAQVCPDNSMRAAYTLTRLTFTMPDGTEIELRDKQTDGTAAGVGICDAAGLNRGKLFVTADGSAATFISDQAITDYIYVPNGGNDLFYPTGDLFLRDGTRYRIEGGKFHGSGIEWQQDDLHLR